MKGVHLMRNGPPPEVCEAVEVESRPPGAGEARVRVMACGINPADLLGFEGRYPGPAPLPAPCGIEGAGVVEAIGDGDMGGEGDVTIGDHVMLLARANWAEEVTAPLGDMIRVPKSLPWRDAAQLKINPPTARMMLTDYETLKPGDWVVQNAANSAVGLHLIRFARDMGVKTVNLVRREEQIAPLKDHGGDVVLIGGEDQGERIRAGIGAEAPLPLGIDAIGGPATRWMADALSDGGTVVNYGYLGGAPCEIEPGHLIVRGQTLTGFWLAGWSAKASNAEKTALYAEMAMAFETGRIVSPVEATYGLDRLSEALAHAWSGGRKGKILLTPNGPID